MRKETIANELLKVAKDLVLAGSDRVSGSALSRLAELVDIEDMDFKDRDSEYIKIRRALVKELVGEHIDYLKKNPSSDPAMVSAGALSNLIDEVISKKYLGKTYPGVFTLIHDIAPKGKSISPKTVLKNAYNKHYGRGVFDELVKNNKRI